jgi:hypothetical protein
MMMAEVKREHRELAVVARYPHAGVPAPESWAHQWVEGKFTGFGADEDCLNAIAQALADLEASVEARVRADEESYGLPECLFPECCRVAAHCAEHVASQEHEAWRRGWYAGSGGESLSENPFRALTPSTSLPETAGEKDDSNGKA